MPSLVHVVGFENEVGIDALLFEVLNHELHRYLELILLLAESLVQMFMVLFDHRLLCRFLCERGVVIGCLTARPPRRRDRLSPLL